MYTWSKVPSEFNAFLLAQIHSILAHSCRWETVDKSVALLVCVCMCVCVCVCVCVCSLVTVLGRVWWEVDRSIFDYLISVAVCLHGCRWQSPQSHAVSVIAKKIEGWGAFLSIVSCDHVCDKMADLSIARLIESIIYVCISKSDTPVSTLIKECYVIWIIFTILVTTRLVRVWFSLQWQEAESAYKNAVAVCNECQYQVHVSAQVCNCNKIFQAIILECCVVL